MKISSSANPRVAVVGAGVLGLMCALRLARGGARVAVYEASPGRSNASRVAAGMIAPATECALEPALREVAGALRGARAEWTGLAGELGVVLAASGAVHTGPAALLDEREALLRELGFRTTRFAHADAVASDGPPLVVEEDATLSTSEALASLHQAAAAATVVFHTAEVRRTARGFEAAGEPVEADAVLLATGAAGRRSGLAPELTHLTPIKGQLLRWGGAGFAPRPILRTPGLYLAATAGAVAAGATMEPGRDDLEPDPALLAPLRAEAEALAPELRRLGDPAIEVGVRADTPDGLPLAGPSRAPGVLLATGARRNGWLWAPPIASIVTATVLGLPLGELAPLAERLHPRRFDRGEAT